MKGLGREIAWWINKHFRTVVVTIIILGTVSVLTVFYVLGGN